MNLITRMLFNGESLIDPRALAEQLVATGLDPGIFWEKANSYRTSAGPAPGVGYLLLTRKQLDQMPDRFQATNTLTLEEFQDGTPHRLILKKLRVVSEEAVYPSFLTAKPDALDPLSTVGPNDPVFVTIEDSRSLAQSLAINAAYNLPTPDDLRTPRAENPLADYTDLLNAIWNQVDDWYGGDKHTSLASTLGTLQVTLPALASNEAQLFPYNHRFHGQKLYDAFHTTINDSFGLAYYYAATHTTQAVLGNGLPTISAALRKQFAEYLDKRRIDQTGYHTRCLFPERVTLHFHTLDFQWDSDSAVSRTPLDKYQQQPAGSMVFNGQALIQNETTPYQIVKGLNYSLWSPLPLIVNDRHQPVEQEEWLKQQRGYVRHHTVGLLRQYHWDSHNLAGLLPLEPTPTLFTVAVYADYGDGLTTTIYRIPPTHIDLTTLEVAPPSFLPEKYASPDISEYRKSPDVSRYHVPHSREGIAQIVYPLTIPKDGNCQIQFLKGLWNEENTTWTPSGPFVDCTNPLGAIENAIGTRVKVYFDHSLSDSGKWVIGSVISKSDSSGGGGGPDPKYPALLALAQSITDDCGTSTVQFNPSTLQYLYTTPHTLPWPNALFLGTAANPLGYKPAEGYAILLFYNNGFPVVIGTEHECVDLFESFKFGLADVSDNPDHGQSCNLLANKFTTSVPKRKPGEKPETLLTGQTVDFLSGIEFDTDNCGVYGKQDTICYLGTPGLEDPPKLQLFNMKSIPEQCCPCQPCDCTSLPNVIDVFITPCPDTSATGCTSWVVRCNEVPSGDPLYEDIIAECGSVIGDDDNPRAWYGTFEYFDPDTGENITWELRICCGGPSGFAAYVHNTAPWTDSYGITQISYTCNPFAFAGRLSSDISNIHLTQLGCDRDPVAVYCVTMGGGSIPATAIPASMNFMNSDLSSYHDADGLPYFGVHPDFEL